MKFVELFHTGKTTPGFLCGCEFEIEDIKSLSNAFPHDHIIMEEDSSLRNNGKEFKTYPNDAATTLELFQTLMKNIIVGNNPFTYRTSTHVHVNMGSFSVQQVRQLILTYALVEPLLFNYVGDKRKSGIYCVPLEYTNLPAIYDKELPQLVNNWHKYTALNIKPLTQFGTVEFRHLYGTGDIEVFKTWLNTLVELYTFIEQRPELDITTALYDTPVATIAREVLPSLTKNMTDYQLATILEDTLLDVKKSAGGLV